MEKYDGFNGSHISCMEINSFYAEASFTAKLEGILWSIKTNFWHKAENSKKQFIFTKLGTFVSWEDISVAIVRNKCFSSSDI